MAGFTTTQLHRVCYRKELTQQPAMAKWTWQQEMEEAIHSQTHTDLHSFTCTDINLMETYPNHEHFTTY